MKRDRIIHILLALGMISFFLGGCVATRMKTGGVTSKELRTEGQNCWVEDDPACDDDTGEFYYFVGQNQVPDLSAGRPSRMAWTSSRNDCMNQFAAFVKTSVASKVKESSSASGDAKTGMLTKSKIESEVNTYVTADTSGLKQVDKHAESLSREGGANKWTVWVRMKVRKDIADQQIAIQSQKIATRLKASQ
ncbi:MAG: hypothetical protein GY866_39060 [Proteobacteria bacterium]|nr:hypothetical protein [Pseudomonadota bacterium]